MRDPVTNKVISSGWSRVTTDPIWAKVEPLSAREFVRSSAMQSAITVRITIRYLAGVEAKMRAVHDDGRIFDIAGVLADTDSGKHYLTLPCSEGVNEG